MNPETDASSNRQRCGRLVAFALAITLACGWAVASAASAATDGGPIETAVEATELAVTSRAIAGQLPVIAAGGALVGLGIGAAVASGVTYWYKNRQIGGKLR